MCPIETSNIQSRKRGTSTTHYTRDAQGNVMGVYNIHLDPNGERPEYLLSEHHIYGSSRLGIQNYFNNDGNSDFIRLVGDKRYELSNHLGNVLSVITDRKLVPNEAKLLYSETFQKATAWIPDNAILLNSSGQLDITCSALDAGIQKQLAFNASTPVIFQMSVTKGTGFPAAVPLVFSVRDMSNHVVWSTIVDDSGIVSGTWTPAVSANYWIKVSVGVAAPFPLLFSIDNFYAYMLPSPPDDFSGLYLPDVVAFNDYFPFGMLVPNRHKSAPDYRYGFNGMEKDDEVKGEGNSINFTYRMHDPRIGRFFATDPLEKKYPQLTPYQFSSNNPIGMKEIEGLEGVKHSEYDIDGNLIRHVVKLKMAVVTVEKLSREIKEELITKLGTKEGRKEWRQIKSKRISSSYNSSDVELIRNTLNDSYNGSNGKGSKNSKGELVYFSFDVQELHVSAKDLAPEGALKQDARFFNGLQTSELLATPLLDGKGNVLFTNKMSPQNLITASSAGSALGNNDNVLTKIGSGNGRDATTINHETAHQLMTQSSELEHSLITKYDFNLTAKAVDQILDDAYEDIASPDNNKINKK